MSVSMDITMKPTYVSNITARNYQEKKRVKEWANDDPINADAEKVNIADDMRFQEIGQERVPRTFR